MPTGLLYRATQLVNDDDLQWMVLQHNELPSSFEHFCLLREGVLSNEAMAEKGLGGRNAADLRSLGRWTGFMREFTTNRNAGHLDLGTDIAVATLVHLFDSGEAITHWMTEVFISDMEKSIGRYVELDQEIVSAVTYKPEGLADESAGMHVLQKTSHGEISSTVVDFRVGRLLGVVFCITFGNVQRRNEMGNVAKTLENKMVKVVLGAA